MKIRFGLRWIPPAILCALGLWIAANHLNQTIFVALNRSAAAWPETLWSATTILGAGACAFALLAPTLIRAPRLMAAALMTAVFAGAFTHIIKPLVRAARPAAVLPPEQIHVIGDVLTSNSFPSGHSVTAFAFAALVIFHAAHPGRAAVWALPLAALVAFSRIAVGAHWPLDTLAGAAGGWLCGMAGEALSRRWSVWNSKVWRIAFALAMLGLGAGLILSNLGYPQAVLLQQLLAVLALIGGALALRHALLLRSPA